MPSRRLLSQGRQEDLELPLPLKGAVAFYNGDAFNNSPAGQLLEAATGSGINLDATQVVAVAAFLRVINALENITETEAILRKAVGKDRRAHDEGFRLPIEEIDDAIMVLAGADLHGEAVIHLREARALTERAAERFSKSLTKDAIRELERARDQMIGSE